MNHPLTHQQCELLSRQPWLDPDVDVESTIHDMRAAADWQLEQVIECLLNSPYKFMSLEGSCKYLRKELRPQEDNS